KDWNHPGTDMKVLFETIISQVPPPSPRESDAAAPLQMLVTTLDYSDYVGRIAIGRVFAGPIRPGMPVAGIDRAGRATQQKTLQVLAFDGLGRRESQGVEAGDLCAIVGLDPIGIGDTIAARENPVALPTIAVDEPTLTMTFRVNDGPFAGREGKYVTSR